MARKSSCVSGEHPESFRGSRRQPADDSSRGDDETGNCEELFGKLPKRTGWQPVLPRSDYSTITDLSAVASAQAGHFNGSPASAKATAWQARRYQSTCRCSSRWDSSDHHQALRCVKGHVAAHAGAGAVGSHNSEMISVVCS